MLSPKLMFQEFARLYSQIRNENALKNGEFIMWMFIAGLINAFTLNVLLELGVIQIVK